MNQRPLQSESALHSSEYKHISEICLEGSFVKQGVIDKDQLHETIELIANGDINYLWPFMHLVSIEMFLKFWDEKVFESKA